MERTKTNIKGFDELIEGGIPSGSAVLLTGNPGTGKTIFALEFIHNGCTKFDEKGLYVSFEEKRLDLIDQAQQFGWNFPELIKKKKLIFLEISPSEITRHTIDELISIAKQNEVKRIVVDSVSTLSIHVPSTMNKDSGQNKYSVMKFIHEFLEKLRSHTEATSLVLSHADNQRMATSDSISEFLCDGVIKVLFESLGGNFSRSLVVSKMRRTKNNEDVHPMEISQKGIVVHSLS